MAQAGIKHGFTRREIERRTANASYLRTEHVDLFKLELAANILNDARYWRAGVAKRGLDTRIWKEDGSLVWGRCYSPAECKELHAHCIWLLRDHRLRTTKHHVNPFVAPEFLALLHAA